MTRARTRIAHDLASRLRWVLALATVVLLALAVAGFGVTSALQLVAAVAFALLAAAILGLGAFVLLLGSR